MSEAIAIRRLDAERPDALRETAALFTEAFDDGSLFFKAFPNPEKRRAVLRLLFEALVADGVRHGGVHIAQCDAQGQAIVGALLWYPPGAYPMTAFRIARQLHHFLAMAATSPRGVYKLHRAQQDFDRRRPQAPHCHASFLAARAGERVGAQLSLALIREADAQGWPIYLETQNRRSVAFYRRMGCELIADGFECFPGGPPTWTMWRPPGAAQQRLRRALEHDTPIAAE